MIIRYYDRGPLRWSIGKVNKSCPLPWGRNKVFGGLDHRRRRDRRLVVHIVVQSLPASRVCRFLAGLQSIAEADHLVQDDVGFADDLWVDVDHDAG